MKPEICPKCGLHCTIRQHRDPVLRENGWKTAECQDCGDERSYKRIKGISGEQFMKVVEEKGITRIIGLFDG